jgi:hypothetical protein
MSPFPGGSFGSTPGSVTGREQLRVASGNPLQPVDISGGCRLAAEGLIAERGHLLVYEKHSFTGKWVHKEGESIESVKIQLDRDGYRGTSTTEPEDLWGGFTICFVKTNDQLLTDRDTRED